MPLRYRHVVPADLSPQDYEASAAHVRHHLSAAASTVDDRREFAAEVILERNDLTDGRIELVGILDREAHADYLADGYDPYDGIPDDLRAEVDR